MAVLPTDYTDATTPTGATTEYPATTSRGLNATHTQINSNTTAIAAFGTAPAGAVVGTTATQTLTNKTLTNPNIDYISDASTGYTAANFTAPSGTANFFQYAGAVAGLNPAITAIGSDTNIGINILPKGSGVINLFVPTGQTPTLAGIGADTNHNLNLTSKGTGVVQANGVEVATLSGTQTLTNKTIDGNSNSLIVRAADMPFGITNGNTARQSQLVVSATNYYITNSNLNLPATLKTGMAVGTRFRWTIAMAKDAAGTGIFQISIYRGTNGTTADTQDVLQTIGTQTAVIDNMTLDVEVVVTTTGATGAYYWAIIPTHTAARITGFGLDQAAASYFSGTVSSVALNTASLKFGLGFKATTGTPTINVPLVRAQALNIS